MRKKTLTHTQDNTPQLFARLLIDFVEWIGVHVICFCFCTALHWFSFFWPFVYFAFDAGNLCLNCPCDCLLCVNAEFAISSFCITLTQSSEKKNKIATIRLRSIGRSVWNELITKIWNVLAAYFLLQFQWLVLIAPPFNTAFATINCWCD